MLQTLQLKDFRCFESVELELSGNNALFIGQNAQGKTSILESVCVLLRLQSPRASTMKEMVRFESESGGFFVGGGWENRQLKFGFSGRLKKLSVDGAVTKKAGEYLGRSGKVVWMGNGDLQLVRGRSEGRRRYLDFIASQLYPDYLSALRSYERAVRARNNLLKDQPTPWAQIDSYTALLVRHGEVLLARRQSLVDMLRPWIIDASTHLSNSSETPGIDFAPTAAPGELEAQLEIARDADARRGLCTIGPHRDDLLLAIDERPAATFGSEGQQRTFALALKLAQARLLGEQQDAEKPILLIDDVFGELDVARRNALLSYLPEDSQKLITTTHLDWAEQDRLEGTHYDVMTGSVERTS